jgi:hypothetical protein
MDLYPGQDMYESFCNYPAALLAEFDRLSQEFKFETVDASADARAVFSHLKAKILELLGADSRGEFLSRLSAKTIESSARKAVEQSPPAPRIAGAQRDLIAVPAHASHGNGHTHLSRKWN